MPNASFSNWRVSWDNFRSTNWIEILAFPELTLQQIQQILALPL